MGVFISYHPCFHIYLLFTLLLSWLRIIHQNYHAANVNRNLSQSIALYGSLCHMFSQFGKCVVVWQFTVNLFFCLFSNYIFIVDSIILAHQDVIQIAGASQATFSYALLWKKMAVFWFKFYRGLFLAVQQFHVMAWCRRGDKPLPESEMAQFTIGSMWQNLMQSPLIHLLLQFACLSFWIWFLWIKINTKSKK